MRFLLIVVTLLVFLFFPPSSQACQCSNSFDYQTLFTSSDSVFIGKAISTSEIPFGDRFLFKVDRSWKGVTNRYVYVDSTLCGYNFSLNTAYLVFAFNSGTRVVSSSCLPGIPLSNLPKELNIFSKPQVTIRPNVIPVQFQYLLPTLYDKLTFNTTISTYLLQLAIGTFLIGPLLGVILTKLIQKKGKTNKPHHRHLKSNK